MDVQQQIREYIDGLPEAKRSGMHILHERILNINPGCRLWFLDGKNSKGKVVSNPNIGYGCYTIHYADGKSRAFYQVGLSANSTGISIYFMGLEDRKYLAETYGTLLGKATVTGYCIKFKKLADINADVLASAIAFGFTAR
ncbi:hypothetical protein HYN48_09010 [Flavobacterium magnum]|uniref:Uncharacterized protein n=1 Tax=Flavobacterium magnum TaxID=2162713 RepID=A0A2S0RG46_9FLAO|nr:DUF1801 domain-containing protein [Flavobacterium magnum]AWA30208.1 hypothetical protein HYN48_09010 [Flavobacterium magnum]